MTVYTTGVTPVANMSNSGLLLTVPSGVTATMAGLLIVATAQLTPYTMAPNSPSNPSAVFTQLAVSAAGNDYVQVWSMTGLVAGDTVFVNGNNTFGYDGSMTFFDDLTAIGSPGAVGIRASSVSTCTTGSFTADPTKRAIVVSVERTTATGTTPIAATSSGGETVTQDFFAETSGGLANSHYVGHFTPSSSGTRTATVTYSGGSGNGFAVLVAGTVLAGAGFTGSASLSGSGALSASGANTSPGTATLSGSGSLSAGVGAPGAKQTAALSGSGTLTARTPTAVENWLADQPFYCAHRGGSDDWVEETLYAYAQAHAWGVRGLEISIWQSSDGVWVASHDRTTGRICGTDLDIPTSTWAALSALRTTVGGYPLAKVTDIMDLYANQHIIFVDNKGGQNMTTFLDMLDSYSGPNRIVYKTFYSGTSLASQARARGYKTWGYYYDADAAGMSATQASYDILGMEFGATTASWATAKSFGKPVMAHIVNSPTAKATALSQGANGMMVSKVTTVIPFSGSSPALSGSGTLTATGTQGTGSAAVLAGSGSLSTTGKAGASAAAALGGSGTLAATGGPGASAPATFTGSGALTTGGATPKPVVAATLTGSGSLAASGVASGSGVGTATLSGVGTLITSGVPKSTGVAALTGSGQLVTVATPRFPVAAVLSGSGTMVANGGITPPRQASYYLWDGVTLNPVHVKAVDLARRRVRFR